MTATLPVSVESEIFYPSADGQPVAEELVEQERQRAEQERQRAEQAELQIEQLKARLRSLNVDPDNIH